jgi:hypothetical protein
MRMREVEEVKDRRNCSCLVVVYHYTSRRDAVMSKLETTEKVLLVTPCALKVQMLTDKGI